PALPLPCLEQHAVTRPAIVRKLDSPSPRVLRCRPMVRRGFILLGCAMIALTGCASSGSVRKLDDESRVRQEQLTEITRANEALRTEVAALRTPLEGLRQDLDR